MRSNDVEAMTVLPRVLDASRPRLRVEVAVSEAAELLFSLTAVLGDNAAETFDIGAERIGEIRASLAPELLELATLLVGGTGCAASLLGVVSETAPPRAVPELVAALESIDPLELQLALLGYYARGHHIADPETIRRAALGEGAAVDELVAAAAAWPEKQPLVRRVLDLGGPLLREHVLELVTRWNDEVFAPRLDEIRPLLERDAAEKRALSESLPAGEFVVRATGGIEYTAPPEIHTLVFFPSWWFRPWVLLSEHKNVRIFGYPIAAGTTEGGADVGDLARLYKALGDEKRLTLLRLLRRGPVALGDAARQVGLSKSTTHHHLAILRHAGLVLIREDEEKSYSLRGERVPEIDRLLAR
jgi:DNA-binding transcriptional ArsR family regulator